MKDQNPELSGFSLVEDQNPELRTSNPKTWSVPTK